MAARAVLAFDGDGDGKDDLAIAGPVFVPGNTPDAEQLHHLRSLGARAFASPVWLDRNLWVMDLSTGDIDADGDLDLAVADLARNAVRFYANTGRQGVDPGHRRGRVVQRAGGARRQPHAIYRPAWWRPTQTRPCAAGSPTCWESRRPSWPTAAPARG